MESTIITVLFLPQFGWVLAGILSAFMVVYIVKQRTKIQAETNIEGVDKQEKEEISEGETKNDACGNEAQNEMIEQLKFFEEGFLKFHELIAVNSNDIKVLCQRFVTGAVETTGALHGAVFLKQVEEKSKEVSLVLTSGYNLPDDDFIHKKFWEGEGNVGTCYSENRVIYIDNLPSEFIKIKSGLGEERSSYLLLIPIQYNGISEGVLELAGFKQPDESKINLIKKVVENLSSIITINRSIEENKAVVNQLQYQIEENKKTQEELSFQNALLNALLKNIPDYIYFKDKDSRFIRISDSMVQLFPGAATSDDLIGMSDFDFQEPEAARIFYKEEQQIMQTGQSIIDKIQHEVFENGFEQWVSSTKMPLIDENGNVVGTFGISKDITDFKKLEMESNKLNHNLKQREKELSLKIEELEGNVKL